MGTHLHNLSSDPGEHSTIVLSGTHDLPAQRSTWHDFLPSGTASVSEKRGER
ncbi:hypothetical protein ACLK19_16435 [Escherichia coli]